MWEMDEGARLWMIKTAHKNFWRVAAWYDLDDLIQDGFMCFYRNQMRVKEGRIKQPTSRAHQMSQFKLTYINHIHDLATKATKQRIEVLASDLVTDEGSEAALWDKLTDLNEYFDIDHASFQALITEAPEPVKAVVRLFTSETGCRKLRSRYRVRINGREKTNERLCRLTGCDPKLDLVSMVKDYFRLDLQTELR